MDFKLISRAVVVLMTTSTRVLREAVVCVSSGRYKCYAVLSDGWYVLFGKAPQSADRSDLVVHVITSLGPRRRATLILMTQQELGLFKTASHLGISVERARRLYNSALASTRARLKWHGVGLWVPSDPPPTKCLPPAESPIRLVTIADLLTESARRDAA